MIAELYFLTRLLVNHNNHRYEYTIIRFVLLSLDGGGEGGGGGGGGGGGDGGGGGGVVFGNMTIPSSSSSHQICVPYFCRIRCLQCNVM